MKRLLLVFAGLWLGMAHAQTVNWDAAFASCSQESAAFDRWAVENYATWGNQGTATWRHVRRDEYTSSTIDVASTRQAVQANRSLLNGGSNPRVALDVCVQQAALNQLQTQTAATAPAAASPKGDPRSEAGIRGCIKRDPANASLINQCNAQIYLSWCAVPHSDSDATRQPCQSQRFSSHLLSPGESVRVDEDALITWLACPESRRTSDLKYVRGTGLTGRCVR